MRTAFREWRVRWDPEEGPLLQSTMSANLWLESELVADQEPEDSIESKRLGGGPNALHGVHACLPWCDSLFLTKPSLSWTSIRLFAIGAVDLQGKVVEHDDGVVRAERVRILAIRLIDFVHWTDLSTSGQEMIQRTDLPCVHDEYHAVSGIYRNYWAFRRKCGPPIGTTTPKTSYGCDGYREMIDWEAPYNVPHEVKLTLSVGQIERTLLERYEVPRLPVGEGPWVPPWGSGPSPRHMDE